MKVLVEGVEIEFQSLEDEKLTPLLIRLAVVFFFGKQKGKLSPRCQDCVTFYPVTIQHPYLTRR